MISINIIIIIIIQIKSVNTPDPHDQIALTGMWNDFPCHCVDQCIIGGTPKYNRHSRHIDDS